jgi:hypothetical protein
LFFWKSHIHSGELDKSPPLTPVQLPKPRNGPDSTRHWQVNGLFGSDGLGFSVQGAASQIAQYLSPE